MMKDILGEEYKGDSKFVADCRKLQSIYRIEIGEEIRPYTDKNGNVHYYGNNLLSSQPMAFNLFCPLRQMLEESPEIAIIEFKDKDGKDGFVISF